jgi:hypothetical protein
MGNILEINNKKLVAKAINNFRLHIPSDLNIDIRRMPTSIKIQFLSIYDKSMIAGFKLEELPSCCAALVSTQSFVNAKFRNEKVAQNMMKLKIAIAKELDYGMMMCTVVNKSTIMKEYDIEKHILEKFGWKMKSRFMNYRNGNIIEEWNLLLVRHTTQGAVDTSYRADEAK